MKTGKIHMTEKNAENFVHMKNGKIHMNTL